MFWYFMRHAAAGSTRRADYFTMVQLAASGRDVGRPYLLFVGKIKCSREKSSSREQK